MPRIKNTRQKGAELENFVADKLVEYGLDSKARRENSSGAGTREKSDISTSAQLLGRNLGIECKNTEKLNIPKYWKQTEKLEVLGREPVLVYKLPNRNPRVVLVSIYLETFLDMLVALQGKDNTTSNVVENYHYDKTSILNSIKYIKGLLGKLENDYNKKILKDN